MVSYPPAKFRKRSSDRRQRQSVAPPAVTISVYEVTTADPPEEGQCIWVFTQPVNVTAIPTGLRVNVGGVWKQPTGMDAVENPTTQVTLYYATTQTLDDKAWDIIATPTGIEEAAQIVVPQSGVVEAP